MPLPPHPSPPKARRAPGRFAELHLHLGGAVLPNILHAYLRRSKHPLLKRYPTVERLERMFARPRRTLDQYVAMHKLVERVQTLSAIPHFIRRLIRGAVLFDNLAYMELRHCPWLRTDAGLPEAQRLQQMESIVAAIDDAARAATRDYPLVFTQILCMHSTLPAALNQRILDLAIAARPSVCAIDLAGPDRLYAGRLAELIPLFKRARRAGLRTTAHLFETADGCHPALLPHLDRVGHGIQIALRHPTLLKSLARRGTCLEICPTSYTRTGTLKGVAELHAVFDRALDAGVPIAICTDNSGLHGVRLPHELESLLVSDILSFDQMRACHRNSFTHAFGWKGAIPSL
ncbi:adenosine deaminase [soil metagenome]